jgi:DNA-binding transcriptional regulator YiaG
MANLASTLKAEISRIARREIRAEVATLRKAATQNRSTIAALKRQVQAVERQVKTSVKGARAAAISDDGEPEKKFRFRAGGFANLRRRLGISAEAMGELLGVTGQSVYKWEAGKARPRARQLETIASLRGIGKKEAASRLERIATREQ